ncbi:MAG: ATP-binding protein [Isosphaeraceae bacterium]
MSIHVRCPRCDRPLKAAPEMIGRRVRCASCHHSFVLDEVDPTDLPSFESIPAIPISTKDETLSRSMLPVRSAPNVPSDEMLGRLEPLTLRWLNATAALESFLGEPLDELRHRGFTEFLHPDDRALAEDEFRKAIELGERHDFVLRFPGPAGLMRFVRVFSQARYNPDGSINHVRCYLKDVTERVQAEEELRRRTEQLTHANEQLRQINQKLKEAQSQLVHSEKLASLGTLAAGMAHEINNPLAFAMNNVAVMGRDTSDLLRLLQLFQQGFAALAAVEPDLASRIAQLEVDIDLPYLRENLPGMSDRTRQGLQRVAKIVENLREFAQLDRSEIALVDINSALDHSLGMLSDALAQHRVKVDRQYTELPLVECAAAPLNQVFLNLLMNALQAIEATGRQAGRIIVATRTEADAILIEVRDDGVGIPAEVVSRIFDPFFTTKPVGRGTGLGLSITHGIIADHGGRIEVESTIGAGSLFRVHLPTQRPDPPSTHVSASG